MESRDEVARFRHHYEPDYAVKLRNSLELLVEMEGRYRIEPTQLFHGRGDF